MIKWRQYSYYLVAFSPIIIGIISGNVLYADDLYRIEYGITNWSGDGRLAAEWLFSFLFLFSGAVDLYPAPQIAGYACICLCSYLISEKVFNEHSVKTLIATSFLVVSPLYLQNMLFRFDSLTMSLAVLMSVIPAVTYKKSLAWVASSIAMLSLAMLLYQQASVVFFSVMLIASFLSISLDEYKDIIIKASLALLCYLVAAVIGVIAVKMSVVDGAYGANHSQLVGLNIDGIMVVNNNIHESFTLMRKAISGNMKYASFIMLLGFLASISIAVIKKRIFLHHAVIILMSLIACIIFAAGITILSSNAAINPRSFIGFGFAFCFCAVVTTYFIGNKSIVFNAPLCVMFFSSCLAITNANTKMDNYQNYIAKSVREHIYNNGEIKDISFSGVLAEPSQVSNVKESFPVANSIVINNMYEGSVNACITLALNGVKVECNTYEPTKYDYEKGVVVWKDPDYKLIKSGSHMIVKFN
ncbi:TPA: glucosyltransferase domain-containing protein [Enterobacter roggenkampii]